MKIPFVHAVMIASLALVGISPVRAQNNEPATKGSPEEEVRKLNVEEVRAFLNKDPKSMAGIWSDDFVVTNPLNKFVNKKQVLGMVESGVLVITSYERIIEYVKIYGDTVIVAGRETVVWGGKMPNAGKTEHLRFTGVWMMQQGRWQQVARHANIVPES